MSEAPAPAKRLTEASKRKLEELIAGGMSIAAAFRAKLEVDAKLRGLAAVPATT